MELKWLPGPPQEAEKSSRCVSWPHPGATSELFFAPGGLQERPVADFKALLGLPLGPHGGQKRPGGVQGFILVPPGAFWGAFWELFLQFSFVFACVLVFALGSLPAWMPSS